MLLEPVVVPAFRAGVAETRAAACFVDIRCDLVVKLPGWNLLSGCCGEPGLGGECGGFVVVLAGYQAVPEAAEKAAEQVALGGGVPVAGLLAAVVVGAGAG